MTRKMKDSGIEWIGEIPEEWSIRRLRFLCSITTGNKDTINAKDDGQYPFYVRSPKIEKIDTYAFDGEAVLTAGDGVGAGKVFHYVNGKFDYHQRVYNLHYFKNIKGKYVYYYLKENFIKEIEKSNAKSTVDSVRLPMLLNFPIVLPSMEEQNNITNYLDKRCTKIDVTIEKEKQVIERLKEYKQSVIIEAVTKGLNPDVPMKDSGVEWIGEIPEYWKVIKIKFLSILNGRIGWQGLTSSEYKDEGPYLITGTDFNNGKINWDSCVHITEERYEEAKQIQVKNGDLLITKDGTVGKVAIVSHLNNKSSLNSGVLLIRPLKENSYRTKFLYYILISRVFWMWFESSKTGNSTIIHLYQEKFKEFKYPLPIIEEQQQIVNYLDKRCSAIDKTITKKQNLIEKLTEYKKSLIYECVTGKREVQ